MSHFEDTLKGYAIATQEPLLTHECRATVKKTCRVTITQNVMEYSFCTCIQNNFRGVH